MTAGKQKTDRRSAVADRRYNDVLFAFCLRGRPGCRHCKAMPRSLARSCQTASRESLAAPFSRPCLARWFVCPLLLLACLPVNGAGLRVGAAAADLQADDSMIIAGGITAGKASGQEGKLRAVA